MKRKKGYNLYNFTKLSRVMSDFHYSGRMAKDEIDPIVTKGEAAVMLLIVIVLSWMVMQNP